MHCYVLEETLDSTLFFRDFSLNTTNMPSYLKPNPAGLPCGSLGFTLTKQAQPSVAPPPDLPLSYLAAERLIRS